MNRAERKAGDVVDVPVPPLPQDVSWCGWSLNPSSDQHNLHMNDATPEGSWLGRSVICSHIVYIFQCIGSIFSLVFDLLCSCFKGSSAAPLKGRVNEETEIQREVEVLTKLFSTGLAEMEVPELNCEETIIKWLGKNEGFPNLIRFLAITFVKLGKEEPDAPIGVSILCIDSDGVPGVYLTIQAVNADGYEYIKRIEQEQRSANSQFIGILVPPGARGEDAPFGQLIFDPLNELEGTLFAGGKYL